MPALVACAMDSCKWNRNGQCDKSEIFVDGGTTCASFEPNMAAMVGPQGADPRSALLQMIARGGRPSVGGPPMGGPPMGAPPTGMPGLPPSQI